MRAGQEWPEDEMPKWEVILERALSDSHRGAFRRVLAFVVFIFFMPVVGALAQEQGEILSVDEIVKHTNRVSYYQGADGQAQVSMTIVDSQGRKRYRKMTILRWDEPGPGVKNTQEDDTYCGEQKFYVYFHRPADVNKMTFLVHKHLERDDDRWLYLPALDLVKRIAATDKRTSFVGSNFFYEDISGRHVDEDIHELWKTTANYYVLKNTPKDPASVEFSYFTLWIHRKTFVVVKTEYYDKRGKKYREYTAKEVKVIQGYPTVVKATMADLRTGGHTALSYASIKYDVGLPETLFTERYLRRPPYKYLR